MIHSLHHVMRMTRAPSGEYVLGVKEIVDGSLIVVGTVRIPR
jgi:hypothetical protein